MSETKGTFAINEKEFEVEQEVIDVFINLMRERDFLVDFLNEVNNAKCKLGNDYDLGRFVRNLINARDNGINETPKTFA